MNARDPADKGLASVSLSNRDAAAIDSDSIQVSAPEIQVEWRPKEFPLWRNSDIWICQVGDLSVLFHNRAKKYIIQHAIETVRREVGGVLIGGAFSDTERKLKFIEITAAIRGDFTHGNAARLTFTADTWSEIIRIAEIEYKDQRIVGWYHTHPNWGVFLSDLDLDIQNNFFDQPDQVALVIDPIRKEGGFFHGTQKNNRGVQVSKLFTWDHSLYFPPVSQINVPEQSHRKSQGEGNRVSRALHDFWTRLLGHFAEDLKKLVVRPSFSDSEPPVLRLTAADISQEVEPISRQDYPSQSVAYSAAWGFVLAVLVALAFILIVGMSYFVFSNRDSIVAAWDSIPRQFSNLRRILQYPVAQGCLVVVLLIGVFGSLLIWAFQEPSDNVR